ncbi:MAG: alpha-1,4-glucan--maltose-1-phosphate maltosyltransferase [Spirochaetota bacterium]
MSRKRVIIEHIRPSVDDGLFPAKRVAGDRVPIRADVYSDGHDLIRAVARYRRAGDADFADVELQPLGNDAWLAHITVEEIGLYEFTVEAWVDHFDTWIDGLRRKVEVDSHTDVDLMIGAELLKAAAARAGGDARETIMTAADLFESDAAPLQERAGRALDEGLVELVRRYPDRSLATRADTLYPISVDPPHARFSAWYEMFPRSTWDLGDSAGPAVAEPTHATLRDVVSRLDYVADLGFDVLYLPPIHPIGRSFRKGRNNALAANADDPGSPWAIGGPEGGHTSIHPDLGTEADFRELVKAAAKRDIRIALDIAFQCSPDHPWVGEHPDWFVRRPDGSIQYAENPPKKYQDIYPINFESDDWESLWVELKGVFEHWIDAGVTIFRVDNPHTKSFPFWEWCIRELKRDYPEAIFLAEAFTRPRRMYGLAKRGFNQSYTYFAWRTQKEELEEYLTELATTEVADFYRPSFWPNTPDILHEYLQLGGRPAFLIRLALAATLSSNYGIYGPAFELQEATPREPGSEEYLDSEKYEIRHWSIGDPRSIAPFIRSINAIRRENPALQRTRGLRFHAVDNDQIIAYSKSSEDRSNVLLIVVNLSYEHTHSAWIEFSPAAVGLHDSRPFEVTELLSGELFTWEDYWNYVQLDPYHNPVQIFRLESE